MKLFKKKWFVLLLLFLPNFGIAFIQFGVNAFSLGSGAGAATVVFLLYLVVKTLFERSRTNRKLIVPISIAVSYIIYYAVIIFL